MLKRFLVAGLVPAIVFLFFLVPHSLAQTEPTEILYLLPFNPGQAPDTVTAALFDALVEHLYTLGEERNLQVTIVKEELTDEDVAWFAQRQYLIGEISHYSEEKGCCYTEIKLTGQVQLQLPGGVKQPIIELSDELFFNHDMTSAQKGLVEICNRLGKKMAEQILVQIDAN
jgi:hypothetical protein